MLVRAAALRCADRSLGLDTVQEPGEANPAKGLRMETGIREGETPKMLHSRMCQRGWSPGAGLSPFYPSLPLEWQKVVSAGAT